MATALSCLHWTQLRELMRGARTQDVWPLRWKRNHLPVGYLASVAGGIVTVIALPYGEELLRCVRAARRTRTT
jgi:hypothetical protein